MGTASVETVIGPENVEALKKILFRGGVALIGVVEKELTGMNFGKYDMTVKTVLSMALPHLQELLTGLE